MKIKANPKHSLYIRPRAMLIIVLIGICLTTLIFFITYKTFTTTDGKILSDNVPSPPGLGKGDWLSFWGCVFSALCTIVLAIFALVQNVNLSMINEKKENTDNYFAKLRFSAEFYSQIEFREISLNRDEDEKVNISFIVESIGKCPPSGFIIKKFGIYGASSQHEITSNIDYKEHELFYLEPETGNAAFKKVRINNDSSSQMFSLSIPILADKLSAFIERYSPIIREEKKELAKSLTFSRVEYTLINPLEVETDYDGVMLMDYNHGWFSRTVELEVENKIVFRVTDSLLERWAYKYIGEMK